MKLKVVTPERLVVEEDVEAVYAKAADGYFGVLPRHVPLVTPLEIGVLRYVKAGGEELPLAVMGGLLRTDGGSVTVLTDAAEQGNEIDVLRAQQAKERAEARLREVKTDLDAARAQKALARATTRIRLGEGAKK